MSRQSLNGDAALQDDLRGRSRWAAVVLFVGLAVIALAVAAVVLVVVAPPLDAVRDRLVRQVYERSGRTLTVAGPLSVSLLPHPVVTLKGVALLPPEGMEAEPTVSVPVIEAEVSLWSLFTRRPKLERLTLRQPTIALVVDAHGHRSWTVARPPKAAANPDASKTPPPAVSRALLVRVVSGTVRYRDERNGTAYEIGTLDLDVTTTDPDAALSAVGSFAWEGNPFQLSATASTLKGPTAAVTLKIAGDPFAVGYEGSLALQGAPAGEGTLSLAHLAYKDIRLGPATLALSVAAGVGKVTLKELALYGGQGQGSLTIDTTGATPALSASLRLADVSLLPLLKASAGAGWVDGRGAIALDLSGQGKSERQIVESLQGHVALKVADGAVTGLDVDRMLRALQRGRLDRLVPRREDRTPFSALTGTFDISAGVAKTADLTLVSRQVELKGEGQIELAPRRIDAVLQTKIDANVDAQTDTKADAKADAGTDAKADTRTDAKPDGSTPADGAAVSIGTLELPIAIKGPLDRPEFTIKGQEALADTIGRIGRNLKSPEVKDAIEGLLSGDKSKRIKPAELLDKLFRKE